MIDSYVAEMQQMEKDIEAKEAEVALLKQKYVTLTEQTIPNELAAMGLRGAVTTDGTEVVIDTAIFVSPPKKTKPKLFEWLEGEGNGGMISRVLSFDLDKDSEEKAKEMIKTMTALHGEIGELEKAVNTNSLKKLIKDEYVKAGKKFPEKLLGFYEKKVAKIVS
jgi:SMC interacting uncharacterized protein involved in chromosome segregation